MKHREEVTVIDLAASIKKENERKKALDTRENLQKEAVKLRKEVDKTLGLLKA